MCDFKAHSDFATASTVSEVPRVNVCFDAICFVTVENERVPEKRRIKAVPEPRSLLFEAIFIRQEAVWKIMKERQPLNCRGQGD